MGVAGVGGVMIRCEKGVGLWRCRTMAIVL